jgi:lysozyme family protein
MTAANLEASLSHIFGSEGGYTANRKDPGNWTGGKVGRGKLKGTKFGIAANSYPDLDIKALTIEQASEIYRRDYAAKIRFDDLPTGLDFAMLDYAINSGPFKAVTELQNIVGVADDGKIGPVTLKAIRACITKALIIRLCDARLAFLKRLKAWKTFGKGWSRRVASVRTAALNMVDEENV